jgi:oxalate decarboxylase/phosphoglucose isomerase-like protein (cupin superfamily)
VKKIARADVKDCGVPPKHFNVNAARLQGEAEEFVLGPLDSLYVGPHEGRSVINNGTRPVIMLVVVNT